jgi:rhamnulokinase
MSYRLAIDIGSSSVKIHAGEYDSGELAFQEVARLDNGTTWEENRHVWDVQTLTESLRDAIVEAVGRYDDVDSIGIDATALDFGLLADGELLRNPYFYRDPSLWSTTEKVAERCSERLAFQLTGYNMSRGPMHFQVQAAPEVFEQADTAIPLPQLLSYELGASQSTEKSYAMTLQMFDIQSQTWADELISAIGFPRDILSDPLPPGTVIGSVNTTDTDLDDGPDIILPPSHDTASAVGGLPLSESNNAFLCTGSWFIPGLEVTEPIVTDEVFDIGGSNEIGVEGTTRFLRNLPGFSLLELCRDQWKAKGKTYEYDRLLKGAAQIGTDTPLIDTRDDLFVEAQFEGNVRERIRTYCERTNQQPPADEFEVTACILMSLVANTAIVLDQLIDIADETVERVHLAGGGVRNELFCQLFASAIDRPVHAGPTEATALGNLFVQMRTAGEINGIEEGREIVSKQFEITEYKPKNQREWTKVRDRLRDPTV